MEIIGNREKYATLWGGDLLLAYAPFTAWGGIGHVYWVGKYSRAAEAHLKQWSRDQVDARQKKACEQAALYGEV